MSGVRPFWSTAFNRAPACTRFHAISVSPLLAANMSGVTSSAGLHSFGSALQSSRRLTSVASPAIAALSSSQPCIDDPVRQREGRREGEREGEGSGSVRRPLHTVTERREDLWIDQSRKKSGGGGKEKNHPKVQG
eukprot:scaffold1392_cov39-Tisochrysis_lutea.AAC.1